MCTCKPKRQLMCVTKTSKVLYYYEHNCRVTLIDPITLAVVGKSSSLAQAEVNLKNNHTLRGIKYRGANNFKKAPQWVKKASINFN
jgi:hypothetical protein